MYRLADHREPKTVNYDDNYLSSVVYLAVPCDSCSLFGPLTRRPKCRPQGDGYGSAGRQSRLAAARPASSNTAAALSPTLTPRRQAGVQVYAAATWSFLLVADGRLRYGGWPVGRPVDRRYRLLGVGPKKDRGGFPFFFSAWGVCERKLQAKKKHVDCTTVVKFSLRNGTTVI